MGVRIPPWDTAEAISPYLDDPRFMGVMDRYFREWVLNCTNDIGRAKIGCNSSNNSLGGDGK